MLSAQHCISGLLRPESCGQSVSMHASVVQAGWRPSLAIHNQAFEERGTHDRECAAGARGEPEFCAAAGALGLQSCPHRQAHR